MILYNLIIYTFFSFAIGKSKKKSEDQDFHHSSPPLSLFSMTKNIFQFVIQAGFEPTTHALEGRCSIQLSY